MTTFNSVVVLVHCLWKHKKQRFLSSCWNRGMNSSLGMNGSLPRRNSYNKSWTRFRSPAPPQGRVRHLSQRIWDNPTPASSQLPRWGSFGKSSTHTCFRLGSAGRWDSSQDFRPWKFLVVGWFRWDFLFGGVQFRPIFSGIIMIVSGRGRKREG